MTAREKELGAKVARLREAQADLIQQLVGEQARACGWLDALRAAEAKCDELAAEVTRLREAFEAIIHYRVDDAHDDILDFIFRIAESALSTPSTATADLRQKHAREGT